MTIFVLDVDSKTKGNIRDEDGCFMIKRSIHFLKIYNLIHTADVHLISKIKVPVDFWS